MMLNSSKPSVIVEDGAVGWHVWIEDGPDGVEHHRFFEVRAEAMAYANGLAIGGNLKIENLSINLGPDIFYDEVQA